MCGQVADLELLRLEKHIATFHSQSEQAGKKPLTLVLGTSGLGTLRATFFKVPVQSLFPVCFNFTTVFIFIQKSTTAISG